MLHFSVCDTGISHGAFQAPLIDELYLNSRPQRVHRLGSLIRRKKKEKKQTRKKPRIVVTIAHAGILAGITAVEPHRGQTRAAGRAAGTGGGGSAVVGR